MKRLCHHGFMDGLVPFSGLTQGAASRFLSQKDPKTNHRVFGQVACATIRRIIDCLLESGDLLLTCVPVYKSGIQPRKLEEVEAELINLNLTTSSGERVNDSASKSSLNLRDDYPGELLTELGKVVLEAVHQRASKHGQHQFRHFALDLVMNTLIPCIMCFHLSRAGQIESKTSLVKHLTPALFGTGKTIYHKGMLYSLRELLCAHPL